MDKTMEELESIRNIEIEFFKAKIEEFNEVIKNRHRDLYDSTIEYDMAFNTISECFVSVGFGMYQSSILNNKDYKSIEEIIKKVNKDIDLLRDSLIDFLKGKFLNETISR
jgi:hypothetical protein